VTEDKRKPGRPALPPSKKLLVVSVRLTPTQRDRLRALGMQRLRDWLDQAK
jgi:hypothetical protein